MRPVPSITVVKVAHSAIWSVMAAAVFYTLYSGITGRIGAWTYASIGLIIIETLVLSVNGWACPLTHVAQEVKPDWKDGDDIFLPTWLATRNKTIFGTLFAIGFLLVIARFLLSR
jgi:hypothetical protein